MSPSAMKWRYSGSGIRYALRSLVKWLGAASVWLMCAWYTCPRTSTNGVFGSVLPPTRTHAGSVPNGIPNVPSQFAPL